MEDRKKDHIDLAFQARTDLDQLDRRFYYEPMLSGHPDDLELGKVFLGKHMKVPVWVSSMTGGTAMAGHINRNLAMVCNEFGMGMGLGSCRTLLESDDHFGDFDLRGIIGDENPFYANLGIAQVEEMVGEGKTDEILELVHRLRADGLIVHVNPLQEWLQPEGSRFHRPPSETVQSLLETSGLRIIVKEVGQGMGYESLKSLLAMPLEAIEFAAFGGTNFARVELLRSGEARQQYLGPLSRLGHDATEMTILVNRILSEEKQVECRQLIISGGVRSFLDGYYLIGLSILPAIYGQASEFLKHARGPYEELKNYVTFQVDGLKLASAYLRIKKQGS
jgi:isopentenyl-diphosphate delta-isomerase